MKNSFLILLCLIVSSLNLQAQKTKNKVVSIPWDSFSNEHYEIKFPTNWTLDLTDEFGTEFLLFSEYASEDDSFRENVNLTIQDLSAYDIGFDDYVKLSENQIRNFIEDGEFLLSEEKKGVDGVFQSVIYTAHQGIHDLKFEQFYWVKEANAYVLTLSCEESQFDKYKEIGEAIMNSFHFK